MKLYKPRHSVFHLISKCLEVGHIRLGSALLCNLHLSVLILDETLLVIYFDLLLVLQFIQTGLLQLDPLEKASQR